MKRITKFTLLGIGALIVVGSFAACSHYRGPEQRAQWMVEKVTNELELNEVQQTKLKRLSDEMMDARKRFKQQFEGSHEQLLALFEQPTLDQNKMLTLVQSHTQAINDGAPGIIASMSEFYDDLTTEQQAEIREFMQEHRDEGHRWGHNNRKSDDSIEEVSR